MPYKVSGLLNRNARIIVINEANWVIESNVQKANGSYSVTGLSIGPKTVLSISDDDAALVFRGIIPLIHDTDAIGGTVSYTGNYKVHTFTSSGVLNIVGGGTFEYLVLAGGGGGGNSMGGGGGAGGMLTGTIYNKDSGMYDIVVGNGGAGATNGGNSSALGITTIGGGAGGSSTNDGSAGGSGGGGSTARGGGTYYPPGGAGIPGQGYAGGNSYQGQNIIAKAGGGGGAGGDGHGWQNDASCFGGIGRTSSITGTSIYYGGGGGSGRATPNDGGDVNARTGGAGGGGRGADGSSYNGATPGTNGLGGGGGGGSYWYDHGDQTAGAHGGSGIVIVRYLFEGAH